MEYRRDGHTCTVRLDPGEFFPDAFFGLLEAETIRAGAFTGLGAFRRARVAFFDVAENEYRDRALDEQLEVVSLVGNVAVHEGEPLVHAHVALGRPDGSLVGGHLQEGVVRPTLEISLHVGERGLRRSVDPEFGLPTLDLEGE